MNKGKGIWKMILNSALVFLLVFVMGENVEAADFQASVSSATATQGETVTVTVTFSSSATIGAYAMKLNYDANILEYSSGADGGGGGSLQFYNDYVNSTSKSYTITFQTKAAGTSNLSFETISVPCDTDTNDMTVKAAGGSVTVSAPVTYSSNNNLSALNVSAVHEDGTTESMNLSPAFSADVTSYNLSVGATVTRLSLDASAQDGKAAVAVSGTRMDPGSNTTTVTVTAENGEVKKYVIYTEKAYPEETTPEETTPEETTPEETTTEEPTTIPEENPQNPLAVTVNDKTFVVSSIPEGVAVPEGYEVTETIYHDVTITAVKGLSTNLVLFYLKNQENQEGAFYIYDEKADVFSPYICLTIRQHMYTIMDFPQELKLPFESLSLELAGSTVQAYRTDYEGIYLLYAMNWNGEYHLYYYDEKEETMLRCMETWEDTEEVVSDVKTPAVDSEKESMERQLKTRNIIILCMALVLFELIMIIILIVIIRKKQRNSDGFEEIEEDEEDSEDSEDIEEDDDTEEYIEPMDEEHLDRELDQILNKK